MLVLIAIFIAAPFVVTATICVLVVRKSKKNTEFNNWKNDIRNWPPVEKRWPVEANQN